MALYDIVAANRQATATGTALGQAMFSNSLRMQELQSQQALLRLQQQQAAQKLAFDLQAHNLAVQERADMTKAMAQVQAESMPFIPAPHGSEDMRLMIGPDGAPMGEPGKIPNPAYKPLDQSLLQNVLPVIAKYRPQEADNFIANTAMLPYRMAEAKRMEALAKQANDEAGPGTIQRVTGDYPNAPTVNVYVPPRGKGSNQLVGEANPEIVTQGGRQFIRNKDGTLKPLAQDANARMTAHALNAQAEKAPDLSIPNPDAPGLRMIDPARFDDFAKRAGITTKTKGELEEREMKAEDVFALGQRLLPLIDEDTTGVKGGLKKWAQDVGVTLLVPSLDDPKVTQASAAATQFSAMLVKALRSDASIDRREVERLQTASKMVGAVTKQAAMTKLSSFVEQARDLAVRSNQRRGLPPPDWTMNKRQLAARIDLPEGDPLHISKEQAHDLYNHSADSMLDQIHRELGQ